MNYVTEIEVETAATPSPGLRLPAVFWVRNRQKIPSDRQSGRGLRFQLQVRDDATLAFVVIDPFSIAPDYRPDIPRADVESMD